MALFDEKEQLRKDRDKIDKKLKDVSENRDKLKQKMKKYRARRARYDAETKTCKKCGKEYSESDNFNWSCRTHQSDFGGEMWWCCGKLGKDAIGCKFNKHESKDDDDDLDEQEMKDKLEHDNTMRNLNIKCYSCGEVGHKSRDCTRDPNCRSNYPPHKELTRISHLALASRKLVRLMGGKEVAALVNTKCGYQVLGDAANEDLLDKPFNSFVNAAWDSHMKRWTSEGYPANAASMPSGSVPEPEEESERESEESSEYEESVEEDEDAQNQEDNNSAGDGEYILSRSDHSGENDDEWR